MGQDLAKYIDEQIKNMSPIFNWKVVKDTTKNLIEVYFTFRVNVDEKVRVQDILGNINHSSYIQFEDVICFYDPAYSFCEPSNYLKAVSMDLRNGLDKGFVDAILKQLKIVTTEGASELIDFSEKLSESEFKLKWSERNLNGTIETLKATDRYDEEKLQMNLDEEETLINRLTKDGQNGGVERV